MSIISSICADEANNKKHEWLSELGYIKATCEDEDILARLNRLYDKMKEHYFSE